MINLLPPDVKQDYRYASYNRLAVRWLLALVAAMVGVAIITSLGLLVMKNTANDYEERNADAKTQLANENLTGVQKQVTDISGSLKLMVTVLSKEVLFSKLLAQLGNTTPPNVILTNLTISQTESAVDITAQTANYNAATQLQVNLADPNNKIFAKADLVSISCSAETASATTNSAYPCTASIRALFDKNNPFLFINASKKAGTP